MLLLVGCAHDQAKPIALSDIAQARILARFGKPFVAEHLQ